MRAGAEEASCGAAGASLTEKEGGKVVNMFSLQGSEGSLESTACFVKNTSPAASLSARFCGNVSCPPQGWQRSLGVEINSKVIPILQRHP